MTVLDAEEIAWVRECAAAGDTPAEIADAAGRPLAEIEAALAGLKPMTERQREIASLFAAGLTLQAIADLRGSRSRYGRNSIGNELNGLRSRGYPIPKRTDRWAERRQAHSPRQEQTA